MENLSVQESLEVIASTIRQTKENMKEQSFYYLLWGWLSLFAALSQYLLIELTTFGMNYLPWFLVAPVGIIVSVVYGKKNRHEKGYETYLETFLKNFWIVIGISFFVIVFISVSLHINPMIFTMFLAGIGTLVSGLAMKYKPLISGGVLFFVFSLASIYVSLPFSLLLFAVAIALGYLLPAYLLKKS